MSEGILLLKTANTELDEPVVQISKSTFWVFTVTPYLWC